MNPVEDRRRAGFFMLTATTLLALVIAAMAGVRLMADDQLYYVEFTESVSGLEPSSPVKYNGVPAGMVTAIRLKPGDVSRIQVEIRVDPDVPVKTDTRASLKPQGITGIFFLELYGGSEAADRMPEGDIIPTDASLAAAISGIATNLAQLVERLNHFFAANEEDLTAAIGDFRAAAASIRGTLERLEGVVDSGKVALDEVRTAVEDIRKEVAATGASVRDAVARAQRLLDDPALAGLSAEAHEILVAARGKIDDLDLKALVEDARGVLADFGTMQESLDRAVAALADVAEGSRADIAIALRNIRTATEHVKVATRNLKDDPGSLLRGSSEVDRSFPDPVSPPEVAR
jgi:phospholipid/cholesterol/gamma-HCH transport system substrate-binding protein